MMDRVIELLLTLRIAATEECRRGHSEACQIAFDIEKIIKIIKTYCVSQT